VSGREEALGLLFSWKGELLEEIAAIAARAPLPHASSSPSSCTRVGDTRGEGLSVDDGDGVHGEDKGVGGGGGGDGREGGDEVGGEDQGLTEVVKAMMSLHGVCLDKLKTERSSLLLRIDSLEKQAHRLQVPGDWGFGVRGSGLGLEVVGSLEVGAQQL
jgi:hypothetical protein